MGNILVTGATSFIGVHIIKEYIKNEWNVIAVTRPDSKNINRLPTGKRIKVIEVDMDQLDQLPDMLRDIKIDVFYHLAWEGARVPYRDDAKLQTMNYLCSLKTMRTASKLGCNTFIGAGSQAEYGRCIGKIDESYEPKPDTEYGKAKLKTYEKLKVLAEEYGIKFIWTRIFSVFGIYDYQGTLVMSAIDKLVRNETLPLTECKQNWDFIYVEDVARVMYLLANLDCEAGIYNIASGSSRQLKDFVIEMKGICNSKSELQFGAIPYSSEGIISFEPVVEKLKKNLGWSCEIQFAEGIRRILQAIG